MLTDLGPAPAVRAGSAVVLVEVMITEVLAEHMEELEEPFVGTHVLHLPRRMVILGNPYHLEEHPQDIMEESPEVAAWYASPLLT